ncbi:MAG: histidine phosphatase family protein [Hyphomicrobiaceae bacterium]
MQVGITIYFIRHGQTEWNRTRRIQGQIDTYLNHTGRQQATRNGAVLKSMRSQVADMDFFASPLTRCRETMEIVRDTLGLPTKEYETDDRLKEIHFGTWQGQYWTDIVNHDPEGCMERQANPYHWRPEGGESYADLSERAGQWLFERRQDAVVVSHGGVSRVLRGSVLDIDPTEVTELSVPQNKVLILRNGEMSWS